MRKPTKADYLAYAGYSRSYQVEGNSVRVDNDIGNHTLHREWHIFLAISHTNSTLLTVTRSKFIPNLRNTDIANSNLGKAVTFFRCTDKNIVNDTIFVSFH